MLFLVVYTVAGSAHASDFYKPWTKTEITQEVIWQALHLIDWGQTRYIAKHPDEYDEVESERWIGRNPSASRVDKFMIVTGLLHWGISWLIPNKIGFDVWGYDFNWRTIFQAVTIVKTAGTVYHNNSIGIRVEF